jgi:photosystem II reaction center protein PsbP
MAIRRPLAALLALAALAMAACGGDDGGDPVEGDGYSYATPDGWDDFSDTAQDEEDLNFHGIRPDSMVVGERQDDFVTNVNVVVQKGSLPGNITARAFAEANLAGLRSPAQAGLPPRVARSIEAMKVREISETQDAELGGEEAVAFEYLTTQAGKDLRIRQLVAVMDRSGYAVTLTAMPGQFEDGLDALDEVADSWEWE